MKIYLDTKDLINILEYGCPLTTSEFQEIIQKENHQLVISCYAVTEICKPIFSSNSQSSEYTASIKTEILSLQNKINIYTYEKLTKIRKSRNDWLHETRDVTARDASLGILICQRLLADVANVQISLSIGYQTTLT